MLDYALHVFIINKKTCLVHKTKQAIQKNTQNNKQVYQELKFMTK